MNALAIYQEQKEAQACTYHRCKRPPADGVQLCDRHLKKQRKADAKSKRRRRAQRRSQGLCAFCPARSKTYRCAACLQKHGVAKSSSESVRSSVDKAARIAERTKTHEDGRTRYHGQPTRGQQTHAQLDEQDFEVAMKHMNTAKTRLDMFRTPEIQGMPRIQRESVRLQATQEFDLATRFVEEIMDRNGHFKPASGAGHAKAKHGKRDGE